MTATNGDINPIPPIKVTMRTKLERLTNCAKISAKSQNTPFNNDPTNDESCDGVSFKPMDPPAACSEKQLVDLSDPQQWRYVLLGNHPVVDNPIPATWDNSYQWFRTFGKWQDFHLETEPFCACGPKGAVRIKGFRSDNQGNIQLENISDSITHTIVAQTTSSMHNFMAQYSAPGGTETIPYNAIGKNYRLKLNLHNDSGNGGGAIKGLVTFTGHWGRCTPQDRVDVIVMDPISADPSIFLDPGLTGGIGGGLFDGNVTIAVIERDPTPGTDGLPVPASPIPTVVTGSDLHEVKTTPQQQFGDRLPANYTIVMGCVNNLITMATQEAVTHVYETDKQCEGTWVKSYTAP
jgi:hypothetical protein